MILEKARSVLERGEPARRCSRPGRAPQPAERRNRAGGADRRAERERAQRRPPTAASCLVHETIVRMRLVSLGDLILDVVVQLDAPLVPGDDRPATTRVGATGTVSRPARMERVGAVRAGLLREDLPAYVVLSDPGGMPVDGPHNWSSGFLPAIYQGTLFRATGVPVANLEQPPGLSIAARERQLEFLNELNTLHRKRHPQNAELAARISNYELAARMQTSVPAILDISGETAATGEVYGLDNPTTAEYGKRCLLARRLVEQGVRFVQLFLDTASPGTRITRTRRPPIIMCPHRSTQCGFGHRLEAARLARLRRSCSGRESSDACRCHRAPTVATTIATPFRYGWPAAAFGKAMSTGPPTSSATPRCRTWSMCPTCTPRCCKPWGLDHEQLTYPHEGRADSLTDVAVNRARVIEKLLS